MKLYALNDVDLFIYTDLFKNRFFAPFSHTYTLFSSLDFFRKMFSRTSTSAMPPINKRRRPSQQQIVDQPTSATDVIFGVLVQLARKLLFIKPANKAIFYLLFVTALSIISLYVELTDNYFTQV